MFPVLNNEFSLCATKWQMSRDVHVIIPLMKIQHQDISSHVVFLLADPEPFINLFMHTVLLEIFGSLESV